MDLLGFFQNYTLINDKFVECWNSQDAMPMSVIILQLWEIYSDSGSFNSL